MSLSHLPDFSFQRYLAAKRTVDDRALNPRVWDALWHRLAALPAPLTVLEIGGGIGTMFERFLAHPATPPLRYRLLDESVDNIAAAAARLTAYPNVALLQDITPPGSARAHPPCPHTLSLTCADLFDVLPTTSIAPIPALFTDVDLLIAHAFLDLVDIPTTLPRLVAALRPGTLLYFTINFDGVTALQPTIDPTFDDLVESLYHRTMDERITNGLPSGDSRSGRHLFHHLQTAGIRVLDAGSSDWVVLPHDGVYPADEAYFLHFIVHTMHGALAGHPALDPARFDRWIATRHRQIEQGELFYIAHQLDYLGVVV